MVRVGVDVGICRIKDERIEKSKAAVIDGWSDQIRRSAAELDRSDEISMSEWSDGQSKPSDVGDGEEVGNKLEII
ncbi:hypothetical protein ACLOJK_010755 [Asimina triloba]